MIPCCSFSCGILQTQTWEPHYATGKGEYIAPSMIVEGGNLALGGGGGGGDLRVPSPLLETLLGCSLN